MTPHHCPPLYRLNQPHNLTAGFPGAEPQRQTSHSIRQVMTTLDYGALPLAGAPGTTAYVLMIAFMVGPSVDLTMQWQSVV